MLLLHMGTCDVRAPAMMNGLTQLRYHRVCGARALKERSRRQLHGAARIGSVTREPVESNEV